VQIKLDRGSGSGHIQEVWFRFQVANSGESSIRMIPAPLWIQNITFQTPSGETIHQIDGTALWLMTIGNYDADSWASISQIVNSSLDYQIGEEIYAGDTNIYYVPIISSFLSTCDFFLPAVDGAMMVTVQFQPSQTIRIPFVSPDDGNMLTLPDFSLVASMEQMRPEDLRRQKDQYRNGRFDFIIPYIRRQTVTQTWNANAQYQIDLSAIKGDVVFALFVLRNSPQQQQALLQFLPITSFQFRNSEGIGIASQQLIEDQYNRWIEGTKRFLGTANSGGTGHIYSQVFSESDAAPLALINTGYKAGSYPFTTNEVLVINTAPAGTTEILTATVTGTAAQGNYTFLFTNPYGSAVTAPLPYNSTADEIATAINNLDIFQGTVTVVGDFSDPGAVTFTYETGYAYTPMASRGYNLVVISNTMVDGTGLPVTVSMQVTTPGVWGIVNGNTYILDIWCFTTSILSQQNGSLRVTNS